MIFAKLLVKVRGDRSLHQYKGLSLAILVPVACRLNSSVFHRVYVFFLFLGFRVVCSRTSKGLVWGV